MSRMRHNTPARIRLAVGVTLALCAAQSGHAQTARSGGGASAQLMQQMQQLASERTSLQAENAKLKKDLEDLRKERDALKGARQAVDRRATTAEASLRQSAVRSQSADQELAQTKQKMQELVGKFRETLAAMRETESKQTSTQQALAARDQDLKSCVDHNKALYQINTEVLSHLEHQTVWTRVAQTEPFTKIKRVQLENLVDEYKERADQQKIAPPAPTSPTTPATTPGGASTPH